MDKVKCKTITVYRPITVKLNPAWPKYQMVCGEIFRIRSPLEVPECLIEKKWCPLEIAA
jgi:hypothetical protein